MHGNVFGPRQLTIILLNFLDIEDIMYNYILYIFVARQSFTCLTFYLPDRAFFGPKGVG